MNKTELRTFIRQCKAATTAEERATWSETLCNKVLALPTWKDASTILLYHALPDEVDTGKLIAAAQHTGKNVLLPVVQGDDLILRLHTGETHQGALGIQEPIGADYTSFQHIDLAVIPGMAFDKEGDRLGRGRGYYDRLLPQLKNTCKIGLCFPFQLVECVPTEGHDISMDVVISE